MAILDQINVKESEQDPTGVDYDIRDRELHTATGQSTVNTSDVVLLKDTNGKYHEITKDSFMSAVRGALGSLIKGYDKGTAINGIAVTGSAGTVNDLGFSSPSDLASVLGGMQRHKVGYAVEVGIGQTVILMEGYRTGIICADAYGDNSFMIVTSFSPDGVTFIQNYNNAVSNLPNEKNKMCIYYDVGDVIKVTNNTSETHSINYTIIYSPR